MFQYFFKTDFFKTLTIKKSLHVSVCHINIWIWLHRHLTLAVVLTSQGFFFFFTAVMIAKVLQETIIVNLHYDKFFYFLISHPLIWEKISLEKYDAFFQSGVFLFFRLCKFTPEISECFKFGTRKFHFSEYKKNIFLRNFFQIIVYFYFLFFEFGLKSALVDYTTRWWLDKEELRKAFTWKWRRGSSF